MNRHVHTLLAPLAALALLALIGVQTSDALRRSGSWGANSRKSTVPAADPYAGLEAQLGRIDNGLPPGGLRDPFAFGSVPQPVRTAVARPYVPPPPPKPVLTAILMDREDPRALLRYESRNYSVRTGDLFAEFRVVSINADQVTIEGRGQRLVLNRPSQGE